jgi:hypothetical protein
MGFTISMPRCPSNVLRSILDRREHDVTNEHSRIPAQYHKLLVRIDALLQEHGATIAAHERVVVEDALVAYPLRQLYQISNVVYSATGVVVVFVEAGKTAVEAALADRRAQAVAKGTPFIAPTHTMYNMHLMYVESVSSSTVRLYERYLRESGISKPGSAFAEFHCARPEDRTLLDVVAADIFRHQHEEHWFHASVRNDAGDIILPADREPPLRERVRALVSARTQMLASKGKGRGTKRAPPTSAQEVVLPLSPVPHPPAPALRLSVGVGAGAGAGAATEVGARGERSPHTQNKLHRTGVDRLASVVGRAATPPL